MKILRNPPDSAARDKKPAALLLVLLILSISSAGQALSAANPAPALPAGKLPPDLSNVTIDQKLDSQVPLNLPFYDENGKQVTLQQYFHDKPVILNLVYYNCTMLCPEVLSGLNKAMRLLTLKLGKDYEVLTVSFDPKDTPQRALMEQQEQIKKLGSAGAGQSWPFLTGDQESIKELTQAVGFRYKWDPRTQQFYHATAIMVLTPQGKVSKYFYGADYNPTDLRLGLIQASHEEIGTVVDEVLLFCCRYNVSTGKYDFLVSRLLSIAGVITLAALGAFLLAMFKLSKPDPKRA